MQTAKKISILDIPFDALTKEAALQTLQDYLQTNSNHLIVTPNPEAVMHSRRDSEFRRVLQSADLVLADGVGITWAARRLKNPLPARVTGCDTAYALLGASSGASFYLLGAAPGVAEQASQNITARFPGLRAAGTHDGYFDSEREKFIIDEICRVKPDILFVGFGMPRQELWAAAHLHSLPCKITMCIGGGIDVMAGKVKRAPLLMRRFGLEWLYRLISQPSRWKRMLDLPRFVYAVLREK